MSMVLSVSINLFDGEELLPAMLASLRPEVDYITIIYQRVSYGGRGCSSTLIDTIGYLTSAGLIDDVYEYEVDSSGYEVNPQIYEAEKRNIGLEMARTYGATHFISLDTDEFIETSVLALAKERTIEHGFDATACKLVDYWISPKYQIPGFGMAWSDFLYIPLIYQIKPDSHFTSKNTDWDFFCVADTTRKLPYKKPHCFEDDIFVHHMLTVRASKERLLSKYLNRSSYIPPALPAENLVDLYWAWSAGESWGPAVNLRDDIFGIEKSFGLLDYSDKADSRNSLTAHFSDNGFLRNSHDNGNPLNEFLGECSEFFNKVSAEIVGSLQGIPAHQISKECVDVECIRDFFVEHRYLFLNAHPRINVIVLTEDHLRLRASCLISWRGAHVSKRETIRTDTSTIIKLNETGFAAVKEKDGVWRVCGFQEMW